MKSIKGKLIALYLGLVLVVMMVSGSFILLSFQSMELQKAHDQMRVYAEKISEQVVLSNDEADFQSGLLSFSQSGSSDSALQGNIISLDGVTIASTASSKPPFKQYKNSVIISAFAGEEAFSRRAETTDGVKWLSFAAPVQINGDTKYVGYTRMNADAIYESINNTVRTITLAVAIAMLLTFFIGYVFSSTLTGPIVALTGKAKQLARGDLDQSVRVYSADEIGQLSETFNYMASELNKTLGEISKEKNKLEILLHNMKDGVLSFDRYGVLVHKNTAADELLDMDESFLSIDEFIKKFEINAGIIIDMMQPGFSKNISFWHGKKYINANFSPYFNEKELQGVVIVLQDNTEFKKLDDMRKEFVANVSHELRTPLTTVKGYTETLMNGAIEEKEVAMDFLDIINAETDRMSFLVRDLLELSRFDNKQIAFRMVKVNVNDFVQENIRQNKLHADNKNQTLTFEPYGNAIQVTADKNRIAQVFNNILTNAIKYSAEGASIKVWIHEDRNFVKISVKDTGMGISKEDLPRIFERFYRVDKARSRAMGGTGLGLAIAKEIMESHGGDITAESVYGKGTTMTMHFPKNPQIKEI
ncbi:MAG: HAMP domain-containing protein [Firmicutes bacterium]|nr:HAMP domain-containing protein [Bacillota bacterium]